MKLRVSLLVFGLVAVSLLAAATGARALEAKIAFVSDRLGDRDIWIMNPDGSDQEPLVSWSGSAENKPAIHPDGTQLAFVSNRDADYELFIYDFATGTPSKVPTGLGWCWAPSWSPDGTELVMSAATSYSLCGAEIYTLNPDGTNLHRWTQNGLPDESPSYSPDSGTVVFHRIQTCFLTYSSDIFQLDLSTGETTRCTFTGSGGEKDINYGANYSPDGAYVIWEGGDRVTSDHQIWVMDSDCGGQTILGGDPNRLDGGPDYSPDGTSIVFHGWYNYQPPRQVYTASALDLSGEVQLTFDGINRDPSWGWVQTQTGTEVEFDLKPGSCPNSVNLGSRGVLPAALLGTSVFDVQDIDVSTLLLETAVAPVRSDYEDVSSPVVNGEECECTTNGSDGFEDLTLKFRTWHILDIVGEVEPGTVVPLTISGNLLDGTPFVGTDCIVIRGGGRMDIPVEESQAVTLYPPDTNPVREQARITYYLPSEMAARLSLYDVIGREVRVLVDGSIASGEHLVTLDTSNLPSGLYFCQLKAGTVEKTERLILID
jgi:Tol biopolymer transport system component